MIFGVGLDIIDLVDFKKTIDRSGEPFIERVFTERERQYCRSQPHPLQSFAARFAAKEASMKALGIAGEEGLTWQDFEVLLSESGRPRIETHGYAASRLISLGIEALQVSLSHSQSAAAAVAVAVKQPVWATIPGGTR